MNPCKQAQIGLQFTQIKMLAKLMDVLSFLKISGEIHTVALIRFVSYKIALLNSQHRFCHSLHRSQNSIIIVYLL